MSTLYHDSRSRYLRSLFVLPLDSWAKRLFPHIQYGFELDILVSDAMDNLCEDNFPGLEEETIEFWRKSDRLWQSGDLIELLRVPFEEIVNSFPSATREKLTNVFQQSWQEKEPLFFQYHRNVS